jgi:2-phospho-L-lactate guanylyltransferase
MSALTAEPFVVVPVRGIGSGKSRLAAVLDRQAHAAFNESLLTRTLSAVGDWRGSLDACVVVSACGRVHEIARAHGASVFEETASAGLNAAASAGARYAAEHGSASVLVLPCDLPLLDAGALAALVRDGQRADVTIAPDESGTGTNALIVPSAAPFEFCFGTNSFAGHCQAAAASGLTVAIHLSAAIAFDVDTPDDYARWTSQSTAKPMV